jgi:hypothetical protein
MEWIKIIGDILTFFGSIFLGGGLIRSKLQIRDEESTYYDNNPYKVEGALKSRPYYQAGLILLVLGFSFALSERLLSILDSTEVLMHISFAIALASTGVMLTLVFMMQQSVKHLKLKALLNDKLFIQIVEDMHHVCLNRKDIATDDMFHEYKNSEIEKLKTAKFKVTENLETDAGKLIESLGYSNDYSAVERLLSDFLTKKTVKSSIE